jgi:Fe-S-cluster containining protein
VSSAASPARAADRGSARVPLCRTGDPAELAKAFATRLAGKTGLRRALEAWALARDTLEGTLRARKVDEGACRKGCDWCCRLRVEIRGVEAVHLARRARGDPALEARVRATAARVAGLDGAARMRADVPCGFLDPASGACAVYEDRPLPCRAYRSRDAGWCRSLVGPDADIAAIAASGAPPVVKEALGIRGLVQRALIEVTPPEWRGVGELNAMTVRVLDAVGPARASGNGSGRTRDD